MSRPYQSSTEDDAHRKAVATGSPLDCSPIHVDDIVLLSEYITGRLYFATLRSSYRPHCTKVNHFFSTDDDFIYLPYHQDFGPLCLSSLMSYCRLLKGKLCCKELRNKRIFHYTSLENPPQRANATFLITAFAVLCLDRSPFEALLHYNPGRKKVPPLMPFRDASLNERSKHILLSDCLNSLYVARQQGFFDPSDFDVFEYERFQAKGHGDLNWVVPRSMLAFTGPRDEGLGYRPRVYVDYFKANGVKAVVRLNRPEYDSGVFLQAGIRHYDLFFPDGTPPTRGIARTFLRLCDEMERMSVCGPAAVAVHCKAGLGRTGVLIASRLVSRYGMRAKEAIAWVRICRPGSIMSCQQEWLENNEKHLLMKDQSFSRFWRGKSSSNNCSPSLNKCFPFGIYSIREKILSKELRPGTEGNEQGRARNSGGQSTSAADGECVKRSNSASLVGVNGQEKVRRPKATKKSDKIHLGKRSHC